MKKILQLIIYILTSKACFSQSVNLNLDFEKIKDNLPIEWQPSENSNYSVSLDSNYVKSGKYSTLIEFIAGFPDFKSISFGIPNYQGKKITLSGYLRTENITDGYAGLWMRIDPSVGFDNMYQKAIRGTTEWTKYEITLNMDPAKTEYIVFGALLAGKGKLWIDNLNVSIDGIDINNLMPIVKKETPADKDKEFDNGSKISNIIPNERNLENLKILGLLWGYLKYYHPSVAKGNFNWDYELFRILPKILDSTNKESRDSIFMDWITKLGTFSEGEVKKVKTSEIKIQPELDWIIESNLSKELTELLLKIKTAKRQNEHYYVKMVPGVGNPEFKNENPYPTIKNPDSGYRLLALYKYWNIIEYFFPYKNLIGENWKTVLVEFIPKFINAKNETEYTLAVLELIGRIHDSHGNILNYNEGIYNYFGKNYANVDLAFIENKPTVLGFFDPNLPKKSGLERGDIITSINNSPVEDIIQSRLKYTPGSNLSAQNRDISASLLRTNDSEISLKIIRNDSLIEKKLTTYSADKINLYAKYLVKDTCLKFFPGEIAYLNNEATKKIYLPQIWDKIQNTKGLIIDNRNYPSDFILYDLCNYLLPKNTQFVKFTEGNILTPGLFTYTKPSFVGKENKRHYKGKVVILVNEISQSSSEFHAMAYKVHPEAIIMGSQTAGADGNVSAFYLPGDIRTWISGIGVYYPDGKETQRIGIVPDIEVKPTVNGIKNNRDEVLEKALEYLNKK